MDTKETNYLAWFIKDYAERVNLKPFVFRNADSYEIEIYKKARFVQFVLTKNSVYALQWTGNRLTSKEHTFAITNDVEEELINLLDWISEDATEAIKL